MLGNIALIGIMIGVMVYASRNDTEMPICLLFYFLSIGIANAGFILQKIIFEHITVSANGVEYQAPGIIFDTDWNNIEKISYHWHHSWRIECLLIDNDQIRIKKWSFPARALPSPLTPFSHKTIIPLSCFAENWRENELGQQIKQYAPQLFSPVEN